MSKQNQTPEEAKAAKKLASSNAMKKRKADAEKAKQDNLKNQIKTGRLVVSQASDAQMKEWKKQRDEIAASPAKKK